MRRNVVSVQRQLDAVPVRLDLPQRMVDAAESLLGLKATGKVRLRNVDGAEECSHPAFFCPHKIPLAVAVFRAEAPALVELAVERMHMAIEDQRAPVNGQCLGGDPRCRQAGHRTP